jgi:hypothetical protein
VVITQRVVVIMQRVVVIPNDVSGQLCPVLKGM